MLSVEQSKKAGGSGGWQAARGAARIEEGERDSEGQREAGGVEDQSSYAIDTVELLLVGPRVDARTPGFRFEDLGSNCNPRVRV